MANKVHLYCGGCQCCLSENLDSIRKGELYSGLKICHDNCLNVFDGGVVMQSVDLKCDCGEVQGHVLSMQPNQARHVICCCDDCQRFAHYLEKDAILDEFGGTRIVQMTPAQVRITQGLGNVQCIRLKPKGVYRWYTACCHTPIANTLSAGVPFVGLIHNIFENEKDIEDCLGPAALRVQVKHALKTPSDRLAAAKGFPVGLILSTAFRLIVAKIQKGDKPTPFFDAYGEPISAPTILSGI